MQPKYIRLYKVVEVHTAASTVRLELPPELTAWRVHPTFHVSLVRAHVPNNNKRFPCRDTATGYDFGTTDEPEWFINEILAHRWVDRGPSPPGIPGALDAGRHHVGALAECKELEALDEYLELCGVQQPCNLPHKPNLPGHACHVTN